MQKPIIGMISPRTTKEDKPFDNYTKFINTYPNRIIEAGGIPIGLIFPNGKFNVEKSSLPNKKFISFLWNFVWVIFKLLI